MPILQIEEPFFQNQFPTTPRSEFKTIPDDSSNFNSTNYPLVKEQKVKSHKPLKKNIKGLKPSKFTKISFTTSQQSFKIVHCFLRPCVIQRVLFKRLWFIKVKQFFRPQTQNRITSYVSLLSYNLILLQICIVADPPVQALIFCGQ